MEKVISAELSFIPIESQNGLDDINTVLDLIKKTDLQYTVGIFSTTVTGAKTNVMSLINQIINTMDNVCGFRFDVKISNVCGCNIQ